MIPSGPGQGKAEGKIAARGAEQETSINRRWRSAHPRRLRLPRRLGREHLLSLR
jgi:hypothetical protein